MGRAPASRLARNGSAPPLSASVIPGGAESVGGSPPPATQHSGKSRRRSEGSVRRVCMAMILRSRGEGTAASMGASGIAPQRCAKKRRSWPQRAGSAPAASSVASQSTSSARCSRRAMYQSTAFQGKSATATAAPRRSQGSRAAQCSRSWRNTRHAVTELAPSAKSWTCRI